MERIISKRLKELRAEKKLSFKALSKEVGISAAALCRWENNQADVASDYLLILCRYYNVTADYLIGLED